MVIASEVSAVFDATVNPWSAFNVTPVVPVRPANTSPPMPEPRLRAALSDTPFALIARGVPDEPISPNTLVPVTKFAASAPLPTMLPPVMASIELLPAFTVPDTLMPVLADR